MINKHKTVLLNKVINNTSLVPGYTNTLWLDLTLGGGGHSAGFLEKYLAVANNRSRKKDSKILDMILVDLDILSISRFLKLIKSKGFSYLDKGDFFLVESPGMTINIYWFNMNFASIWNDSRFKQITSTYLKENSALSAIIDLGPSQNQISSRKYGMSYKANTDLDMRMDKNLLVSAADLLNVLERKKLIKLFREYADLRNPSILVNQIIDFRRVVQIKTTADLNLIIENAGYTSNTAQIYQGLRIAVNLEYQNLIDSLIGYSDLIKIFDRSMLQVITFHSGEKKVLKRKLKELNLEEKKIIYPSPSEIRSNPRSRSAALHLIYHQKH